MTCRLMVTLEQREADALAHLAALELRDPREEARFLVRQELIRLGLLKQEVNPSRPSDRDTISPSVTQ